MASTAGMAALTSKRDLDRVRRDIEAAGYKGERVVLLSPQDIPSVKSLAEVTEDLLKKVGLNVDAQAMDWATAVQRRNQCRPGRPGRLEHLPDLVGRPRPVQPRRPHLPPRQR